jgi:hypothetical protein
MIGKTCFIRNMEAKNEIEVKESKEILVKLALSKQCNSI